MSNTAFQNRNGSSGTSGTSGSSGISGSSGTSGVDGSFGGATFDYTFDTSINNSDPGQGKVRLNNTTENISTAIYLDSTDDNATNIDNFLITVDTSTSALKGYVRIANKIDPTQYLLFSIVD